MKTLIIGLAAAFVLVVAALAMVMHQAKTPDKADCLYAAMAAFKDGDHRPDIGPEGSNQVRLDPQFGASGWVNDVGLLFPERFPRNVVGSVALICMGATPQPYAGPVVVTGWHPHLEVCGLSKEVRRSLSITVRDTALALDGDVEATRGLDAEWCAAVADAAHQIRTAPVAPIRLIPLEDRS